MLADQNIKKFRPLTPEEKQELKMRISLDISRWYSEQGLHSQTHDKQYET